MDELKVTPLYNQYKDKSFIFKFAGWRLPLYFTSQREEHMKVRTDVGVFDVSHMGEIRVQGEKALDFLEWLTTNQVGKLKKQKAQYNLLLNEKGGVVDDIILYCFEEKRDYLLCVNASNIEKDLQWLHRYNTYKVKITDESQEWAQLALQGPRSFEVLKKLFKDFIPPPRFSFAIYDDLIIATTGYTGEKGVEIFCPPQKAPSLWQNLLDNKVSPIGFAARDSLRIEFNYPLYGQELTEGTNPLEAGLSWVVKVSEKEFLGSQELKKSNYNNILVGFVMESSVIPRTGYKLFSFDKKPLGCVTSGTYSPVLEASIGIGYVRKDYTKKEEGLNIIIRNKNYKAKIVETPFIRTNIRTK